MPRTLGLILAFLRAHVRRVLEYRTNFLIGFAAIGSRHAINLAALWVIFSRVRTLGEWTPYEVVFLYGYVALVGAIWHLLFANTLRVEFLVRDGTFDLYLVRPLPPLFQLAFHYFDDDALGDFVPAVACLVVASRHLELEFTATGVLLLALGAVGGALIHLGINLLMSAWSFWFVKSRALIHLYSDVRRVADYPLGIFPRPAQLLLTFVLPLAFAGYFPAAHVLGRVDATMPMAGIAWLALPVGVVTVIIGAAVWNAGLARYQGTGS